jgi:hypothetical protein
LVEQALADCHTGLANNQLYRTTRFPGQCGLGESAGEKLKTTDRTGVHHPVLFPLAKCSTCIAGGAGEEAWDQQKGRPHATGLSEVRAAIGWSQKKTDSSIEWRHARESLNLHGWIDRSITASVGLCSTIQSSEMPNGSDILTNRIRLRTPNETLKPTQMIFECPLNVVPDPFCGPIFRNPPRIAI